MPWPGRRRAKTVNIVGNLSEPVWDLLTTDERGLLFLLEDHLNGRFTEGQVVERLITRRKILRRSGDEETYRDRSGRRYSKSRYIPE